MNKTDLVEKVASETGITKGRAKKGIDVLFSAIKRALKEGDTVTIVGFGTFALGGRRERVGRNPRTGDELTIHAANIPKFHAGKSFKDEVNAPSVKKSRQQNDCSDQAG